MARLRLLILVMTIVTAGGCLYGAYRVAIVFPQRPLPILLALVAATIAAWYTAVPLGWRGNERDQSYVYASGICGGIVGELAHYLIVGVPSSVPSGFAWILVGAGGIGGAIGVGLAMLVSFTWLTISSVSFLWHTRRRRGA